MMKLRQWIGRWRSDVWSNWPGQAYAKRRYQRRLLAVQEHFAECLDAAPPGPVRILSTCAGDGRDLIGVLHGHVRRSDVSAWLVELNPESVAAGKVHATKAGLDGAVHFLNEDATDFATYTNIPPADIVLVCGVWGHVPAPEREQLVRALACLCTPGGAVIWTRGVSKGMERLREIESQFSGPAWERVRVDLTPDGRFAIATYRYRGTPQTRPDAGRIFRFELAAGR